MTIASDNRAYAKMLQGKLSAIPSVGLKAAAKVALQQALLQTLQDSGEAASNWNLAWNGETKRMYVFSKGFSPVGREREKRGFGDRRVVTYTYARELESAPENAESVVLYNPITDTKHEIYALIQSAGTHAEDPIPLGRAVEKAVNAYLR